jgi:trigger factor
MKVTNEKTENRQAYLTIEMEPAEVEESLEKTFRKLVQTRRVPGFRAGKAPRAIFERYYTRQSLLSDAIDQLVPDAYRKAIEEQSIEPFANPQIEITQMDPVIFKAVVPLAPVVELGEYNQIRVPPETPRETGEKEIDEVIERLRHQHAVWEPASREARSGDRLTIDITSEIDGTPYITQKDAEYEAVAGSAFPVTGFAEQLFGMKRKEEKEFELDFPADDVRKDYAGKKGKFKIKLTEIKEEKLPELGDDLAKQVGEEFSTLAQLREKAGTNLKETAEENARLSFEDKVLEAAVEKCKVEYPEVIVDAEIHNLMDQRFQTRQQFENYIKAIGKTEEEVHDEMHEELEPQAVTRVKRSLVLGKVAEAEKIEAPDLEVDAEIEKVLASAGPNREALSQSLNSAEMRESIRRRMITRKTMERLLEIARTAVPGEEKQDKPEKEEKKETPKPKRTRTKKEEAK